MTMADTTYDAVLSALAPGDRARVQSDVMTLRVYGGVSGVGRAGCEYGVGSWLSEALRGRGPLVTLASAPIRSALGIISPASAAPAAPAARRESTSNSSTMLILAGLGLVALLALKK